MDNFKCLRPSISNFSEFKEEASDQLLNAYQHHKNGVHGVDKPLTSSLPAWAMILLEVHMWLNCIKRRMWANPKASYPWTIEVRRDLPQELFDVIRKSVHGALTRFGVSIEETVIKYSHKKGVSSVTYQNFLVCLKVKYEKNLRKPLVENVKALRQRCL